MSEQLMGEFQAVQQRLRVVDQQMAAIEAQAVEARRALQTLEGLKADQSGLVPIGSGFHVRATLHGDQPIVVPVGSGYAADQDISKGIELLSARVDEAMEMLRKTEQEADKLAQSAQQMAGQLQAAQAAEKQD